MSFYSESTDKIKGKIASLKAIAEKSKSKYLKTPSKINNLMDAIMDIYSQLGGYNDMIKTIENILSKKLDEIEEVIKSAIKVSLKRTISCSVEPSIGDFLIISGITFELDKVDPTSKLTIDPISENGSYAYYDNLSGINSKDFNTFLYTVIKKTINNNSYSGAIWYKTEIQNNESVKIPLFKISYKEYSEETHMTNILTVRLDESLRGQKLSYFISEYLDSVKLFNNVQVISSIFDEILGTKILSINKTTEQLTAEAQIKSIVDNIINNVEDETYIVDDSYYTFSNDTYNEMLENSEKKKNGIFTYNPNTNTNLEVDQELLLNSLDGLKADDLSISEQTKIFTDTIDTVTNDLINNSGIGLEFETSFKTNIIKTILTKLMLTISMTILSPKIIFLFSMTTRIFGLDDENNVVDFIKKNINVFKLIVLAIRDAIITELINSIKELLAPMITSMVMELTKEKFAIYKKVLKNIKKII